MQQIGRLTIGRKDGESFMVGDSTRVTISHISMRHQHATLEIQRGSLTSRVHAKQDQVIPVTPEVEMILRFDGQHGRQAKVTIVAPKNISIMRSELLNEQQKLAVGS